MSNIHFFYLSQVSILRDRKALKHFLMERSKSIRPIDSLNIIFCDDAYLLTINRQFLEHDFYTDIITFDLSSSLKDPIQGEIYISIERVKDNAKMLKVPCVKELHRVIFHGLLHLLGYKDKSPKDELEMRCMEETFLSAYFK